MKGLEMYSTGNLNRWLKGPDLKGCTWYVSVGRKEWGLINILYAESNIQGTRVNLWMGRSSRWKDSGAILMYV